MRLIGWLIAIPAGLIVIAFAVANRGTVTLNLDPFPLAIDAPVWTIAVGGLLAGFLLGALIRWLFDHKWRHMARSGRRRIQLLEREVANLRAKQDEKKPAAPAPGQQGLGLEARQQIMPPRDAA